MIRTINSCLLLAVLFFTIGFAGCKKDDSDPTGYSDNYPMQITSFSPAEGTVGTQLMIKGRNFSTDTSKIKVSINGVPLKVIGSDGTQILAAMTAKTGSGPVIVSVGDKNVITSTADFNYTYSYTVTTLAGSGSSGSADGVGAAASFNFSGVRSQLSVDDNGNVYVADGGNQKIRKVAPDGTVTTIAGSGGNGSNDGKASEASFNNPSGTAVDASGNVYVSERNGDRVRKITPDGQVITLASGITREITSVVVNKTTGAIYASAFYGDGIMQVKNGGWFKVINHSLPCTITIDAAGNIYATHYDDQTVIKYAYDANADKFDNGSVIAGQNRNGGWADGIGTNALFNRPWGIAVDANNNLYVAGQGGGDNSNCVRKIDAGSKAVTTIAGTAGTTGKDNGSGSAAKFNAPTGVAVDKNGTVYVLDMNNNLIRKITVE